MNYSKYDHVSDEEIIADIRKGYTEAMTYILNKYKNVVRGKARGLFLIGGESEDLIQEGMIGLFEAIQNFDDKKDMSFRSFAELCITRQMYTAIKASQRKKHGPLNSYISLDYNTAGSEDEQPIRLEDLLTDDISTEDLFIDKENTAWFEKKILDVLSPFELEVLGLYLKGIGYAEIAELLDKTQKSVDNALQRIKNKIKNLI